MVRIESFLAARLFMSPQRVGDRLFFISNLSGKLSLYAMDVGGSVPELLLPPDLALPNPTLMDGYSFHVFPDLEQIVVMIDQDGDENYQPMSIPIGGGFPEPAFGAAFDGYRVHMFHCDIDANTAYFGAQSRTEQMIDAFQGDLNTGQLVKLGGSPYGRWPVGVNEQNTKAVLLENYTVGDCVIYLWEQGVEGNRLLYGKPMEQREPGEQVPLNSISYADFTPEDRGLLIYTSLFEDTYGAGYLELSEGAEPEPVTINGLVHEGNGELYDMGDLKDDRYYLSYNIDGCSWGYECTFDEQARELNVQAVLYGEGELSQGVTQAMDFDKRNDCYVLAFSTATSPAQLYTLDDGQVQRQTNERVLGVPQSWMSPGEDASFDSFDGLRVSARLYLPSPELEFKGPLPLVYYLHGGPQSQERPDFTWFSMPLIQYLTLHGFAVFVPNARGSTGYGLAYTKLVDRDWGGNDRLDHVHAMKMLTDDPRLDTSRTCLVGRSYGGYMTLTLAGRHPDLWGAAVDMFGPYDLITFSERIPPTWKPYFKLVIGDPETEEGQALMTDRSPKTYLNQLACPMLVIQGANDPRVVAQESRDLVEALKAQGKEIDILVFENEGHDVLKFENRVRCYNAITEFFEQHTRGERMPAG